MTPKTLLAILAALVVLYALLPRSASLRITKPGSLGGPRRNPMGKYDRGAARVSTLVNLGLHPIDEGEPRGAEPEVTK